MRIIQALPAKRQQSSSRANHHHRHHHHHNKIHGSFGAIATSTTGSTNSRLFASVTGTVYTAGDSNKNNNDVVVTLYTKEGCTLCDKVKDVLKELSNEEHQSYAHSLQQIDITDDDQTDSYDRYKYDIPVLHIGCGGEKNNNVDNNNDDNDGNISVYWTKHRLDMEEAKEAITEAMGGSFEPRKGRPNAAAMER